MVQSKGVLQSEYESLEGNDRYECSSQCNDSETVNERDQNHESVLMSEFNVRRRKVNKASKEDTREAMD